MLNDVLTDEEKASDAILIGKPIRVQRKRTKGLKCQKTRFTLADRLNGETPLIWVGIIK